jgi:hypothetical protein
MRDESSGTAQSLTARMLWRNGLDAFLTPPVRFLTAFTHRRNLHREPAAAEASGQIGVRLHGVPGRPNASNDLEGACDADETGNVVNVIVLIGAMLFPTLLGWGMVGAAKLWRRMEARQRGPTPVGQPIERIAADLRRLNGRRSALGTQPPEPGRRIRARALEAAYTDVLLAACRALDVRPPLVAADGCASPSEIDRVEGELRDRGLDVGWTTG